MSTNAPGTQSTWMTTVAPTDFPRASPCHVDVAIVGGGIAGVTAGYLLTRAGRSVAVIEMDRIGRGNTGLTSAHLTWLLDETVHALRKDHGDDHTRTVLGAHAAAIDEIERIARAESIECDFARVPAWRFGVHAKDQRQLERDVVEARSLGRPCEFVPAAEVPVPAPGGAMRVPDQARFHPLVYVTQLARAVAGNGSHVFEQSRVDSMRETPDGWELHIGDTVVTATDVIVASHSPMGIVPQVQTRVAPYQSYVISAEVPRGTLQDALYYDTNEPYQYVRVQPGADRDVLIVGGFDHHTGEEHDTRKPHAALERYLRESLAVTDYRVTHAWSGQVLEPVDGLAYIGKLPGGGAKRWIATGFSGNGLTWGTIAGMLLRDRILGVENPWADVFDPARVKPLASIKDFVTSNAEVGWKFVSGWLAPAESRSITDVAPGDGRIVRVYGRRLAVYRDDAGAVHAMSPVCTHMGCHVDWNPQERTWDCGCHGSRFNATGEVHTGPATRELEKVDLASDPKAR